MLCFLVTASLIASGRKPLFKPINSCLTVIRKLKEQSPWLWVCKNTEMFCIRKLDACVEKSLGNNQGKTPFVEGIKN